MEIVKTKNKDIKRVVDNKGIYQKLMLVPASDVWRKINGKWQINDKYQYVGKLDKNELSIVQKVHRTEKTLILLVMLTIFVGCKNT